ERVRPVADETALGQVRHVDLLTSHRLDRKSPQCLDGTDRLTHRRLPSSRREPILAPRPGSGKRAPPTTPEAGSVVKRGRVGLAHVLLAEAVDGGPEVGEEDGGEVAAEAVAHDDTKHVDGVERGRELV